MAIIVVVLVMSFSFSITISLTITITLSISISLSLSISLSRFFGFVWVSEKPTGFFGFFWVSEKPTGFSWVFLFLGDDRLFCRSLYFFLILTDTFSFFKDKVAVFIQIIAEKMENVGKAVLKKEKFIMNLQTGKKNFFVVLYK